MTDIASLQLKIDSTQAKTAQGDLENLSKEAENTEKSINLMGVAIGASVAAAATGTAMFIKSGIEAADTMNDLHLKTGLAFSDLAAYDLLARQSGTDINGMADGFKNLGKYMIEHGDKLRSIGVTSKDQSVAMGQFADIIAGIEDPALRTSLAMEVLGKSGVNLLPALIGGSAAFEDAKKNSEGYGKSLEGAAGNADEFNDLMAIGTTKTNQFKTELASSLLPVLIELAKGFTSASTASASIESSFNPITETLRGLAIIGGNVAFVFKTIGTEIGGMAAQMAAISSGDFAGFTAIGDAMKNDAIESRNAFDAWEKNMLSAGKTSDEESKKQIENTKKLSEEQEKAIKLAIAGAEKKKKATKEIVDSGEKTIEQMKREADVYGLTAGQIKIYDAAIAGATNAQMEQIIAMAEAMDARDAAAKAAEKNAKDMAEANKKAAKESTKSWETFADQTQRAFGDILYNSMMGTFSNIGDMFKSMLARMAADAAAAKLTQALFGGTGTAGGGLIGGVLGAIFGNSQSGMLSSQESGFSSGDLASWGGSARASGGPVAGGSSYLVGEKGPEIFTPQSAGNITANSNIGGGGISISDNTVINIDSRSDRAQIMTDIRRMIENGNAKLVDQLQRNGQIA